MQLLCFYFGRLLALISSVQSYIYIFSFIICYTARIFLFFFFGPNENCDKCPTVVKLDEEIL